MSRVIIFLYEEEPLFLEDVTELFYTGKDLHITHSEGEDDFNLEDIFRLELNP